jgi:hypothetical protein
MGLELQGKLSSLLSQGELRDKMFACFASLGWKLVRSDGGCNAFTFNDPSLTSFGEDFMVCFEDGIYLLDHLVGPEDTTKRLKRAIEDSLSPLSVSMTWEEI